ncbi:MFS transporter [Myroides odoratus]|uniref:Vacuole effluxer Atg22 like n=1 Tax=Myroides odoratus TaxID=256 RepID=A0A378U5W7_MYROD|nr:MFS transporter [Myroides odoratus]MCS4237690.1 UMF1 family MFS transporter [Myroides odoratus]MDH6601568.1 UMF1 family MFS transporter [Myroides gitamensis]QQU02786.1 MFS transporter [Myroides odoratus]STZ69984.1 Vacuole effluxer Atg22 like [Myroides odoratus]
MKNFQKGDPKLLNAWAFYDWANSVYALVISSSIFPLYYGMLFRARAINSYSFFGIEMNSESIISYITALGFLLIAIISPLLSGIADYLGTKKFFMKLFCAIGATSCMLLYFFSLDYFGWSLLIYMMGLIGFWGSLVFYNSYLPDIAFEEQQDRISAKGYALGYIGSVLLLVINLGLVMNAEKLGFEDATQAMRMSFILVGVWWIAFSQITFRRLPDFKNDKKLTREIFFKGFKELKKVWGLLQEHTILKRYLVAFFVYSMAVQTVMIIAAFFGEKEIAWADDQQRSMGLIVSIMLIQIIAILGAFATSSLSKRIGNIRTLCVLNVLWVFICIYAYTIITPNEFYVAAAFVGLVMGGIQSLSRSTYAKLLPETTDTTSFFSFYDVTEKIGIVVGMSIYGLISDLTGKMQNAILFLILFFIVGFFLLLRVKDKKN